MYKVPKHLDPRLEDDWNYRPENNNMDGEIIVCWEGKGLSRDIIFEGNPTPGMLPIDDEAKEVSGKFSWTPTQGIDEDSQRQSFYSRLGDTLIEQMSELKVARELSPVNSGMEKFMETMLVMMQQNQQILAALAGKASVPNQVIDEEPPLDEVEPTEVELAESSRQAAERQTASEQKALNRMASRRI